MASHELRSAFAHRGLSPPALFGIAGASFRPDTQCRPEYRHRGALLLLFLLFSLVSSSSLLLPLPFGSCFLACPLRFVPLRFTLLRLTLPSLVSASPPLTILASPSVSRFPSLHALACLYARLLCCCSLFYLPSLRDLSSLPSPDVRSISSSLRSLSFSFFSCACSCSLLVPYAACFCVCVCCAVALLHRTPCSPLSQIRSRRSRGVSRVTPPHERAPLTSVIIPVGFVFVRKAAPPALECYLIRLPGSDEDQGTLRVGLIDSSGHTEGTYASVVRGGHFSQPCSFESLPSWASFVLSHLLDCPPLSGWVSPRISSRLPSLLRTSSP